jgi:peptide subunit release factor RF-3
LLLQAEEAEQLLKQLKHEVKRRRNFAIISHPDAGKTTLVSSMGAH